MILTTILAGIAMMAVAFVAAAPVLAMVKMGDRQANDILFAHARKHGIAYGTAIADPDYYKRIRATHTSRRVVQTTPRRLAKYGL